MIYCKEDIPDEEEVLEEEYDYMNEPELEEEYADDEYREEDEIDYCD